MGQIKEHVFGKSARRLRHQGLDCRWSAPLLVGHLFTIALSCLGTEEGLPVMKLPVPEIHRKMTEVNGLTIQQVMSEDAKVCQTLYGCQYMRGPSSDLMLSCISACKLFFIVVFLTGQRVVKAHCFLGPIELQRLQTTFSHACII